MVHILDAQCEQLAEAQPEAGLHDHHGPVASGHCGGQGADLIDGERHDAFPVG
ncbi:hypothetical protein PSH03_002464 [Micromonospora sp. PSH03]|uniref:hypothetical protein n=1 Tax=Micromonospora TaxID=1873 RepID=UPI001EE82F9C|nr:MULTISPECIES: hypothetical protein [Micromonospora]MCG5457355.1 hypothetical protein [Micromonospora salmantinae]